MAGGELMAGEYPSNHVPREINLTAGQGGVQIHPNFNHQPK
jgi:hypothetical protein